MAMNSNIFGGMTLKALLENPDLQHAPAALCGAPHSNLKGKKTQGGNAGDIDFTSAFLGPQLWDRNYQDGSDFNLEYMDLDEFLSENGIPAVEELVGTSPATSPRGSPSAVVGLQGMSPRISPPQSPGNSSSMGLAPMPQSPLHSHSALAHSLSPTPLSLSHSSSTPLPRPLSVSASHSPPSSAGSVSHSRGTSGLQINPSPFQLQPKVESAEDLLQKTFERNSSSPGALSACSSPPASPLPVKVDFSLSEQDIALSSIPGQGMYDPTTVNFTEDELKPQPMIKKSRKIFVPEDLKDDKYWARRKKNNYAAKRSRDARRIKENQIAMRASYLEKENNTLRDQMDKMRRDNSRLKQRLSKYEPASS